MGHLGFYEQRHRLVYGWRMSHPYEMTKLARTLLALILFHCGGSAEPVAIESAPLHPLRCVLAVRIPLGVELTAAMGDCAPDAGATWYLDEDRSTRCDAQRAPIGSWCYPQIECVPGGDCAVAAWRVYGVVE